MKQVVLILLCLFSSIARTADIKYSVALRNAQANTIEPTVGPNPVLRLCGSSTGAEPSAVPISPGASIQAAINANPNGTVFNLDAGTWVNQTFTPKPGNQFIGAPGGTTTILTGSDSVNSLYANPGTVAIPGVLMKDIVVEHYDLPHGPSVLSSECGSGAIQGAVGWTFENMTWVRLF